MTSESSEDLKVKFRKALEKKAGKTVSGNIKNGEPKVRIGQTLNGAPKMFRRKSGSS